MASWQACYAGGTTLLVSPMKALHDLVQLGPLCSRLYASCLNFDPHLSVRLISHTLGSLRMYVTVPVAHVALAADGGLPPVSRAWPEFPPDAELRLAMVSH